MHLNKFFLISGKNSTLLSAIKVSNASFSQVTVDKILNVIFKRVLKIKSQSTRFFSGKIHKLRRNSETSSLGTLH